MTIKDPLWLRLKFHLDDRFDIAPLYAGKGVENDTRVVASSVLWCNFRSMAAGDIKQRALMLLDKFNDKTKSSLENKIFVEVAREALKFLEANPQ